MRRLSVLISFFLCNGCAQISQGPYLSHFTENRKPQVAIGEMEDLANTVQSKRATTAFTQSILGKLSERNRLSLTNNKQQFLVNLKLIQHEELLQTPPELSVSIQLEILDVRTAASLVVLNEVISYSTLLDTPLNDLGPISWEKTTFRTSPLGLAYAKLSREIASRIEDYILLAGKG